MRPAAQFLSLTRQRKKPKKGDPTGCDPCASLRGNLCRRAVGVGRRNSLRACSAPLRQLRPVSSRSACMLRCTRHPANTPPQAHPEGKRNSHTGHRVARPRGSRREALAQSGPSAAMARFVFLPLWTCREAQSGRWAQAAQHARASCSDSLQLFERSANGAQRVLQRDRPIEHRRLPRSIAAATRPVGSPSFAFFSWRVKKRRCAAGRISRPHNLDQARHPTSAHRTSYSKFNSCPRRSL